MSSTTAWHGSPGQIASDRSISVAPAASAAARSRTSFWRPNASIRDVAQRVMSASVLGQADRHVEPRRRRVADDRDRARDLVEQPRHRLALAGRVGVGLDLGRQPAIGRHDGEVRLGLDQALHDLRPPGLAFGVLALQDRRVDRQVDEDARRLGEWEQAPAVGVGDRLDGREPVGRMRVADEGDRERAVTVAVDAVGRLAAAQAHEAAVADDPLLVRAGGGQGRPDVGGERPGVRDGRGSRSGLGAAGRGGADGVAAGVEIGGAARRRRDARRRRRARRPRRAAGGRRPGAGVAPTLAPAAPARPTRWPGATRRPSTRPRL